MNPDVEFADDRTLLRCTQCTLGIALSDHTTRGADGERYHHGFDDKPCGPVVAVPVRPAR